MLNATQSHLRIKNINNKIETNLSFLTLYFGVILFSEKCFYLCTLYYTNEKYF